MVRIIQSLACGAFITGLLLATGIATGSETVWCVVMWHVCVLTAVFKPGRESPAILFLVLLGVPIYAVIAYYLLGKLRPRRAADGEQIVGREPR